jgi:hypothetical protein
MINIALSARKYSLITDLGWLDWWQWNNDPKSGIFLTYF